MCDAGGNLTEMKDMSFQAGAGRSYKYLKPSIKPLYEFAAGLSFTTFLLRPASSGVVNVRSAPTTVCVNVTNTGKRSSPVVVSLFSAPITPPVGHVVPNRQLIAFGKAHTNPGGMAVNMCFDIADADLAMVDDSGSHIAFAGNYVLTFFDGATKVITKATIASTRTVSTIPAVDNPQPPCCQGTERSCC